ncbi:hypothetical protein [Vibrio algivorus]|uniref:Uncharacterized protein n=1 Tax=Vibrio algivorus TaxID=1667024 RepID=A0A557P6C6_9VIBR|nr:hypothetical protein [Vibrio algivorus]TVO36208.1 hypothetical protein FOF44_09865 [Vibrio algivorus]
MSISFDVVINSEDYSVDMNSGLDTLKGASEVTQQIATTLLVDKVPQKLTSDNKVRTTLKRSFKGSFGQVFSLEFYDEEAKKRFNKMGKSVFIELMSYFINEALFQNTLKLSKKATATLEKMGGELEENLLNQLRKSSLSHLHASPNKFNKDVSLRFRKSRVEQKVIATLNKETYKTLVPKTDRKKIQITASITRLNINTGNGRLLLKGKDETIAFGFPLQKHYRQLKVASKKIFSDNLHINNGQEKENWKTLNLVAHTLKTHDGKIIKYLLEGIENV